MASSRRTVVRRMNIFLYMKDELKDEIQKAMFLGIMADDSTDTAVSEQLILYMRYADISREAISTRFACVQKVEGHPNALNLFKVADGILFDLSVPKVFIVEEKVVAFVSLLRNGRKPMPISLSIIKVYAEQVAKSLGEHEFKASNGWWQKLMKRNSIGKSVRLFSLNFIFKLIFHVQKDVHPSYNSSTTTCHISKLFTQRISS